MILEQEHYSNALEIFDAAVARAPAQPAIHYFEQTISYAELDAMAEAFAGRLVQSGFLPGDRLALYVQNMPQFVIVLLATWKAGGICVPVNPMNRQRELALIFADCTPRALVCLDDLYLDVVVQVEPALIPEHVYRLDIREFRVSANAFTVGTQLDATPDGLTRFSQSPGPQRVGRAAGDAQSTALLVYTSGTTGAPKGTMITHANFVFNSNAFCEVAALAHGDVVLGIAPLFHITGSVACLGVAIRLAAPIVLMYRFEPALALEMIERWQPTFVVAAITAFIALFNHDSASRERLRCLQKVYSGGAAVPKSFVDQFEIKFGHYIHNCYGLTETASATHIVPYGSRAPVSDVGQVLSIGRVAPGVAAYVIDETGVRLTHGVAGELIIVGPMVAAGYWNNPTETAINMRSDGFRTGDVALQDDDGWFYLVDRMKDMIISSGYKVWPREVEDVLYSHPAIREAAVVGIEDAYRGESVKAFVSFKPDATVANSDLIEFCRSRMAAYKYPRSIEVLADLPKTASGKILRRALR